MKKKIQIIFIDGDSNYNQTFIVNKLILYLLSSIIIISLSFTIWGIYTLINPSINQKINITKIKY